MRRKGAMVATFAGTAARRRPVAKIRQKLDSQKLVKLTDYSYAFNILTNFYHYSNAMTGNGNGVNF
jgi:hypothetical protein